MAAQLFAMDSFPVPLKTKAIYFVKIGKVPVPKENPSSVLIIGDMACKPIEQLATIVDDVSRLNVYYKHRCILNSRKIRLQLRFGIYYIIQLLV